MHNVLRVLILYCVECHRWWFNVTIIQLNFNTDVQFFNWKLTSKTLFFITLNVPNWEKTVRDKRNKKI